MLSLLSNENIFSFFQEKEITKLSKVGCIVSLETGKHQPPKVILDGRMQDVVSCRAELNNVVHMFKQRRMAEDVKIKFTNKTQWYLEKGILYSFPSQVHVFMTI